MVAANEVKPQFSPELTAKEASADGPAAAIVRLRVIDKHIIRREVVCGAPPELLDEPVAFGCLISLAKDQLARKALKTRTVLASHGAA